MFVDTVPSAVASFALVAGLVTITPGLDTALVLRYAVTHGRKTAYATALGVVTGCLIWGVAASAGVSALLAASEVAYAALRLAGAAYLLWLGVGLLIKAFRQHGNGASTTRIESSPTIDLWASWRRGFGVNILNPKIGAFYVALLPQFIPPDVSPVLMGALLAGVHSVEGMVWFSLIIAAAHAMRAWLDRPRTRRSLDALTGTTLIGFGVVLALRER